MTNKVYTFIYCEYGDSCDGFPRIADKTWKDKEDACKAMEEQAKVNCIDSPYYYNKHSEDKIFIYDSNTEELAMSLCVVSVDVPDISMRFPYCPETYC